VEGVTDSSGSLTSSSMESLRPGLSGDRSRARRGLREEVEADAGGGAGQVDTEEGVAEGDGEAPHDPIVDNRADEDQVPETRGVVADPRLRAALAQGHECGQMEAGHKEDQAIGGEGR